MTYAEATLLHKVQKKRGLQANFSFLFSASFFSPTTISHKTIVSCFHSLMKKLGRQIVITSLTILLSLISFSQKKSAFVSGKVIDENENPLAQVSVTILGRTSGVSTNDSGYFRIKVQAERAFALVFTYTGRRQEQKN